MEFRLVCGPDLGAGQIRVLPYTVHMGAKQPVEKIKAGQGAGSRNTTGSESSTGLV